MWLLSGWSRRWLWRCTQVWICHLRCMFCYLQLHYADIRVFNTVFVLVDNRDLTAPRTDQESLAHWPTVEAWWVSRLGMHGPAGELCDLIYISISAAAGLEHVHPTWTSTFVLAALVFLFPVFTLCCWTAIVCRSLCLKLLRVCVRLLATHRGHSTEYGEIHPLWWWGGGHAIAVSIYAAKRPHRWSFPVGNLKQGFMSTAASSAGLRWGRTWGIEYIAPCQTILWTGAYQWLLGESPARAAFGGPSTRIPNWSP